MLVTSPIIRDASRSAPVFPPVGLDEHGNNYYIQIGVSELLDKITFSTFYLFEMDKNLAIVSRYCFFYESFGNSSYILKKSGRDFCKSKSQLLNFKILSALDDFYGAESIIKNMIKHCLYIKI